VWRSINHSHTQCCGVVVLKFLISNIFFISPLHTGFEILRCCEENLKCGKRVRTQSMAVIFIKKKERFTVAKKIYIWFVQLDKNVYTSTWRVCNACHGVPNNVHRRFGSTKKVLLFYFHTSAPPASRKFHACNENIFVLLYSSIYLFWNL